MRLSMQDLTNKITVKKKMSQDKLKVKKKNKNLSNHAMNLPLSGEREERVEGSVLDLL